MQTGRGDDNRIIKNRDAEQPSDAWAGVTQ